MAINTSSFILWPGIATRLKMITLMVYLALQNGVVRCAIPVVSTSKIKYCTCCPHQLKSLATTSSESSSQTFSSHRIHTHRQMLSELTWRTNVRSEVALYRPPFKWLAMLSKSYRFLTKIRANTILK